MFVLLLELHGGRLNLSFSAARQSLAIREMGINLTMQGCGEECRKQ